MNILYLVNSGNYGGVEKHIFDLSAGLIKHGHKVYIWCKEGPFTSYYKSTGAEVLIKPINADIDFQYISDLSKFLKNNKIDVLHVHELKAGVNGILAGVLAGTKVKISHIHTPMSEWRVDGFLKKAFTFLENKFYTLLVDLFVTKEIALTQSRKQLKIKEGIRENKIVVIGNGIDVTPFVEEALKKKENRIQICQRYGIPSDAVLIGNIGRLTEEKGIDVLIRAFDLLVKATNVFGKYVLILAGEGKLADEFKKLVKDLDLTSKVFFISPVDDELKPKLYSAMDYFVFPSLAEGFGIVMAEAMVSSLPVIASDLPVLKEVGGDDVIYFQTGNSKALAEAIKTAVNLDNTTRAEKVKRMQDRVVKLYGMESFIKNYSNLYESLITG